MPNVLAYALYLAMFVVQGALRLPYARRREHERRPRFGPVEGVLFGAFFVALLPLPLLALAGALAFADIAPPLIVQLLGLGLFAASQVLFWRSHRDLGELWSPIVELQPRHRLITGGVYRTIRHPMYASEWLWVIAQALLLPNLVAGLGGLLAWGAVYVVRVAREEAAMRARFGDAWDAYCARTGRVLPRMFH